MKTVPILAALLLLNALIQPSARAASPVPPIITNIVSVQRAGTMFVDTTFDIIDPDSTNLFIFAECSINGGTSYTVPFVTISGDLGFVTPGTGKKITWNAWTDFANNYSTNARIRITADDSLSGIVFPTPPTNPPAPNLAYIPSGSFNMQGTLVYLSRSFWMGRYEVTQGEYLQLVTNNPSYFLGDTNRPVEKVTWTEATNYCALLTARERAAGRVTTNQNYRLPTEAEWDYACRAGTTTQFYYGDDGTYLRLPAYAWYSANSGSQTHTVGTRIPNRWGLYDMAGNVFEWCSDWSASLPGGNVTDPQGPGSGSSRVFRGGGWSYSGDFCLSAYRGGNTPSLRDNWLGFRVVLAPAQ